MQRPRIVPELSQNFKGSIETSEMHTRNIIDKIHPKSTREEKIEKTI